MSIPSIEKIEGVRFSDEGKTVHLRVKLDGRLAELTMPSDALVGIHDTLGGVIAALRDAGIVPPAPPKAQQAAHQIKSWKLGGNTFDGHFTALLIDEGLSTEHLLVFPDLAALQIADAIEQKVLSGMSMEDQKKLLAEVEKSTGRRPRIILPTRGVRH